jgi:hypothetical protein
MNPNAVEGNVQRRAFRRRMGGHWAVVLVFGRVWYVFASSLDASQRITSRCTGDAPRARADSVGNDRERHSRLSGRSPGELHRSS